MKSKRFLFDEKHLKFLKDNKTIKMKVCPECEGQGDVSSTTERDCDVQTCRNCKGKGEVQ